MKQVLIHKVDAIKNMAGKKVEIFAYPEILADLTLKQGFNHLSIPFKTLVEESVVLIAEAPFDLLLKGVSVPGVRYGDDKLEILINSPSEMVLTKKTLLVTIRMVEICSYRQLEPIPEIRIFGEIPRFDLPQKTVRKRRGKKTPE